MLLFLLFLLLPIFSGFYFFFKILDSYRCILHREVLVQPLIEMLHYADVQFREMSSFALGRLA